MCYFPRPPSLQLTEGSTTHCAVQLPGRKSFGLPPAADEVAQPGDPEEQRPGTKEQEPCLKVGTYTLGSCTGQPMPLHVHNCLVAMRGFIPSKIWLLPPRGLGEQILKTLLGTLSSSLFTQQIGGFSFEVRI